jgi:glycosyltransferase involved in cell wall biosynthesis
VIHALLKKYHVLYMLSDTTAIWLILPRMLGKTVVVNTDGIEWRRSKWPWYGKALLKLNESIATKITRHLIVDSQEMGRYYRSRYDKTTTYITNGGELIESINPEILRESNLIPGKYFSVICRLEPENNIHTIIEAFRTVDRDFQLAIAGGANYKSKYVEHLRRLAKDDPRIVFLGVRPDPAFQRELRTNCLAYIHGHQVGGTNPSLVEAMGAGNIILANGNSFNHEVTGDAAIYWTKEKNDLPEKMKYVIDNYDHLLTFGEKAKKRCKELYGWDTIADLHEAYFKKIIEEA